MTNQYLLTATFTWDSPESHQRFYESFATSGFGENVKEARADAKREIKCDRNFKGIFDLKIK